MTKIAMIAMLLSATPVQKQCTTICYPKPCPDCTQVCDTFCSARPEYAPIPIQSRCTTVCSGNPRTCTTRCQ